MRRVYMDANATTPLLPEVFEAMRPYFLEQFGNASSIHQHGQQARAAVEQAREQVAALVGSRPAEIVFTSGATESDNLALFGMMVEPGAHLVTTSIEHHAVLHAAEQLAERGFALTVVPVSAEGVVDPEDVRRALRPETRLISVMMANNETGAIQPVAEIGRIAAEADVYFHVDAVQAAGKLRMDVKELGCDLLSLSAHKLHGPQGAGALYVRRGTRLAPLFYGGLHERQRRAGTENVAGLVGFGAAAGMARAAVTDGSMQRVAAMRDRLEAGLLRAIEEAGVNGPTLPGARTPNTTNLWFDHLEGEALVIALDLKGLAVSGGSACASGATEPSHVLLAMGVSDPRARASLRFSLSRLNTDEDVDRALSLVPASVARLRALSPVYVPAQAAGEQPGI
ncbi:MAG TPA: cysteine desulfurase family protein [Acidobacteriaceae bacterium]